jgi:predicted amidophosphoribosyltransferase
MTNSGRTSLPNRLTAIDETTRGDHYYLAEADRCFCFGEYFADQGFGHSPTNQLIFNYKCKPTEKSARLRWKDQAIATIAAGVRDAIARQEVERHTWVPIPSSKLPDHAEYDDRIVKTLRRAFAGYDVDIRELLRQSANANADHGSNSRMTPECLFELLNVDHGAWDRAPPRSIILFDDVLTTGKHFKACERRLREINPTLSIVGVFVARRALQRHIDDFEIRVIG